MAYFAHIGGFLFGLLAIKLFADRRPRGLRARSTVSRCTDGPHARPRRQPGDHLPAGVPDDLGAVETAIDMLVVLSLIILALLGFGVLGALTIAAAR